MKNQLAYIDEYGDSGLDFSNKGTSKLFIVSSIIIDEKNIHEIESLLEIIRARHFQKGEIKSSTIANNNPRRSRILSEICKLDFHIFSIIIDKQALKGEGFNYHQSFYKFLHGLLDRELFKTFPDILVVSDEHGGKEFMSGFIKYIESKHMPDLFSQSEFKFSNSKSNLILQLADFITGTLSKCYEGKNKTKIASDFLSIIKDKIIEIRFWPLNYRPLAYNPQTDCVNYNPNIADLGLNLAMQFLNENAKSKTPAIIDQCSCLNYLLFYFRNINPEKYVFTKEIIRHIEANRPGSKISMHYFRSKIIAKLRDFNVLISSTPSGYKLPANKNDLYDFIKHSNSYIQPMIDRVLKCQKVIKLATKNDIDVLNHEELKYLYIIRNSIQ